MRTQHHDVEGPGEVRLHVVETGPPDRPAVLLLHGVGSSSTFLREAFAAPVVEAGWRLLAADLRGHGGSSALPEVADHGFDHHVADVVTLVDRFAPQVVGGVSLGGHACVGAAAAGVACEAVVACLPAWSGRAVPGEGPHAAVATEVATIGVTGLLDRFDDDTTMVPWLRDVLLRDWPSHDPASLAAALLALDGGQAPTGVELAELPVPLGVVGWPDDPGHPLAVARDWASTAPRGQLVTTSLDAMQADRAAMGRAAMAVLADLGVTAP